MTTPLDTADPRGKDKTVETAFCLGLLPGTFAIFSPLTWLSKIPEMTVQLPFDVQGTAAGVLVYTFVCLFCSVALFAVVWIHRDRFNCGFSDVRLGDIRSPANPSRVVSLLALFTGLSSVSSIAQQINTIIWWRDLKLEHLHHVMSDPTNPELILVGSSTGANLVLFYIRMSQFR